MSPTVDDLSKRLDEQLAEEAAALADLEALHRNRAAVLLSGSDRALVDHDGKAAAAERRLERARAWVVQLKAELAEAKAREAEAPKQVAYDLAQRRAAALTKRLSEQYTDLARKLAELL